MISINGLTLENFSQIGTTETPLYSGEIWLDGTKQGAFKENLFDEPITVEFKSTSTKKKVQSICNRYFKMYPPIVDGLKNSIEAMITELHLMNMALETHDSAIAIVFMLKETLVYAIDDDITMEDILRNIAIEYPDTSEKVKVFKLEQGTDLLLGV